jgi:hypothetical protein
MQGHGGFATPTAEAAPLEDTIRSIVIPATAGIHGDAERNVSRLCSVSQHLRPSCIG